MSSLDSEFFRRLTLRLDEMKNKVGEHVLSGNMDDGHYKRQCGYLEALRHVGEVAQTIESNINEGK